MKIAPKTVIVLAGIVLLLPGSPRPAQAADAVQDPFAPADGPTAVAPTSTSMVMPSTPAAKPAIKPLKTAAQAANDILDLVKNTREDTAFVSATVHPAVNTDLTNLETAANAVLKDDGQNKAATDQVVSDFVAAINQLISRVNSTANRPKETDDVRAKCHAIQQLLTATRIAFQPTPLPTAPKPSTAKPAVAAGSALAAGSGNNADTKMVLPSKPAPRATVATVAAVVKVPTTTTEQLLAVQAELKKAEASLAKASTNTFGGKIEKSRIDAATASADVVVALAYMKDHPELDPLPEGVPPTEKEKIDIPTVPASNINPTTGKQKSPNIANAVESLAATLRLIMDTPKGGTAPLVLVRDLDGNRDKILDDINLTNQDLQAGFVFAANRNGGANAAAATAVSAASLKPVVRAPTLAALIQTEKDFFQQQPAGATMTNVQRVVSPALGQVFSATFYRANAPAAGSSPTTAPWKETFAREGAELTPMELPAATAAMPAALKLLKPDFTLKTKTDALILMTALNAVYPIVAPTAEDKAVADTIQQDGNNWSLVRGVNAKTLQGIVCTTNTDGSITSLGFSMDIPKPAVAEAPAAKATVKPEVAGADAPGAMVLPTAKP